MTDTVLKQLSAVANMDIATLKDTWKRMFKTEAPKFNRAYLEKKIAYRIQEVAYGGLTPETKQKIRNLRNDINAGSRERNRSLPPAGTMIVREYQGVEHRVIVLDDGFEYQGHKYTNLSIIARVITGTRWSGPVFFGLKRQS